MVTGDEEEQVVGAQDGERESDEEGVTEEDTAVFWAAAQ